MHTVNRNDHRRRETEQFKRLRYFYGKMMDVSQFELESHYYNSKRWMINHLVFGYGVICGLDVRADPRESDTLIVTAGVALDRWGREIIVPDQYKLRIKPEDVEEAREGCGEPWDGWLYVKLCYQECLAEPEPVFAGECECAAECEAGVIRESYKVFAGAGEDQRRKCLDICTRRPEELWKALCVHVSRPDACPPIAEDPCIVLAKIRLPRDPDHSCEVDISVRRIVFTNRLLADLVMCLAPDRGKQRNEESGERE